MRYWMVDQQKLVDVEPELSGKRKECRCHVEWPGSVPGLDGYLVLVASL